MKMNAFLQKLENIWHFISILLITQIFISGLFIYYILGFSLLNTILSSIFILLITIAFIIEQIYEKRMRYKYRIYNKVRSQIYFP